MELAWHCAKRLLNHNSFEFISALMELRGCRSSLQFNLPEVAQAIGHGSG
jgi:hypothetical protein